MVRRRVCVSDRASSETDKLSALQVHCLAYEGIITEADEVALGAFSVSCRDDEAEELSAVGFDRFRL